MTGIRLPCKPIKTTSWESNHYHEKSCQLTRVKAQPMWATTKYAWTTHQPNSSSELSSPPSSNNCETLTLHLLLRQSPNTTYCHHWSMIQTEWGSKGKKSMGIRKHWMCSCTEIYARKRSRSELMRVQHWWWSRLSIKLKWVMTHSMILSYQVCLTSMCMRRNTCQDSLRKRKRMCPIIQASMVSRSNAGTRTSCNSFIHHIKRTLTHHRDQAMPFIWTTQSIDKRIEYPLVFGESSNRGNA